MMFVQLEDLLLVARRGMPIMSQMICSGSGAAISLDEVALAVGDCSIRRSTIAVALVAHVVLDAGRPASGVKPLATIDAQPECLRVVHVDHRAEELAISCGMSPMFAALARAEQLRVAARCPDVLVAGERPVARALGR